MVNGITNLWQSFRESVKGIESSSQLAGGVALGMAIGLLPKDSLFPYCLVVVLLASRANLLSAACSALVFSWIGPLLDPLTHEIGIRVLTFDPLESTWVWLEQLPVVPWTRFDNTVVMGSLIAGLGLALPVYQLSKRFFNSFGNAVFDYLRNTRTICRLVGPKKQKLSGGRA